MPFLTASEFAVVPEQGSRIRGKRILAAETQREGEGIKREPKSYSNCQYRRTAQDRRKEMGSPQRMDPPSSTRANTPSRGIMQSPAW